MVISIFFVMLALSVIFLVCVEIALLLDCRVPHVMYIVQFRDVLLDSNNGRSRGGPVQDLTFIGLTLIMFLVMIGYVSFCARMN